MLKVGDEAPDFSLPSDSGANVTLKNFKGHTLVLYFFPKADTPG
jgi:peroxiredoxin Q/BCP